MSTVTPVRDDVLVSTGAVVRVAAADLAAVKRLGAQSPRKRSRLCAHRSAQDAVHEMLICLTQGTYVRPHRHPGKSESFHVIEGNVTVILFHGDGGVRDVIPMGAYHTGATFYYRLGEPLYHTVRVDSEYVLLHETTTGPFAPDDTEFAPWAPAEGGPGAARYADGLRALVGPTPPGAP